jgi:hypothetical protein
MAFKGISDVKEQTALPISIHLTPNIITGHKLSVERT